MTKRLTPKQKREARRQWLRDSRDSMAVYIAVTGGVFFEEISREFDFVSLPRFSWGQIGAGLAFGYFAMKHFERTNDKAKRREAWKRRMAHAFGTGMVAKGLIEVGWRLIQYFKGGV